MLYSLDTNIFIYILYNNVFFFIFVAYFLTISSVPTEKCAKLSVRNKLVRASQVYVPA